MIATISALLWALPKCFDILSIPALCRPAPQLAFGFICTCARGVKVPWLSCPERRGNGASTGLAEGFSLLGGPAPLSANRYLPHRSASQLGRIVPPIRPPLPVPKGKPPDWDSYPPGQYDRPTDFLIFRSDGSS